MKKIGLTILPFLLIFAGCAVNVQNLIREGKLEEAKRECDKRPPDKQAECRILIGDTYFQREDYEKAGEFYKLANHNEGLIKIAEIYIVAENYKEAEKYYALGESLTPDIYIRLSDLAIKKGAIADFEKYYIQGGKSDKDISIRLAEYYLNRDDYEKAYEYYKNADAEKRGGLKIGDKFFSKQDYEQARYYYQKSGNTEKEKITLTKLGEIALEKKDYEKAREYFSGSGETNRIEIVDNRLSLVGDTQAQLLAILSVDELIRAYNALPRRIRENISKDITFYIKTLSELKEADTIVTRNIDGQTLNRYNQAYPAYLEVYEQYREVIKTSDDLPTLRQHRAKLDEQKRILNDIVFRFETRLKEAQDEIDLRVDSAAEAFLEITDKDLRLRINAAFLRLRHFPGMYFWVERFKEKTREE
jgi:tetratricopeptide (TPR) repeat protein